MKKNNPLTATRLTLTREEYQAFQNETPRQRYARLFNAERDEFIKETYRVILEQLNIAEAMEQLKAEHESKKAPYLREEALEAGPLIRQYLTWYLADIYAFLKCKGLAILHALIHLSVFLFEKTHIFFVSTVTAMVVYTMYFNIHFGLGPNLIAGQLFLLATGFAGFAFLYKLAEIVNNPPRMLKTIMIVIMLFDLASVGLLTGYASVTPDRGFVVLTTRNGEVINAVDTGKSFFMTPPSIFHGDKTIFFDYVPPEIFQKINEETQAKKVRVQLDREDLLGEKFERRYVSNGKNLVVTVTTYKTVNLEGFSILPQSGGHPMDYRLDIRLQVDNFLDEIFKAPENALIQLAQLEKNINNISNQLFGLENTVVTFQYQEN